MPSHDWPRIATREITERADYLRRREFIRSAAGALVGASALGSASFARAATTPPAASGAAVALRPEPIVERFTPAIDPYRLDPSADALTDRDDATSYNNFYEFGADKRDPSRNAHTLRPRPWSVLVEGEVSKPGSIPLEALLEPHTLEERVYRLRCVEAWSMVIPWIGIPLAKVLERFEPTSKAKYVLFQTLHDPTQMPAQQRSTLDWPYVEGLRIDEAMHPLALLAVGMYGEDLPNQNGAPLRLVIPWKYGFKSIKSIVRIRFQSEEPRTTWNIAIPDEYGFYANVNPDVSHPRWSQGRERRIGEFRKRRTLPFNGYAEQVAHLYAGMDLRKNY